MIQSHELRIGNWIYSTSHKQYCKVIKLEYDSELLNIAPITLTEEILLKCGFEYYSSNNSYQLDFDLNFCIWGRIENGFNVYCCSEELGDTLNYLHQLQNIIFTLTGKELEVNL